MSRFKFAALLFVGAAVAAGGDSSTLSSSQTGAANATTDQVVSLVNAFQQEQDILDQERSDLVSNGASQAQLDAWASQHAGEIATQTSRTEAMAVISGLQPQSTTIVANIPQGASKTLSDFLVTRAALQNARTAIHNQLIAQANAQGASFTFANLVQLQDQEGKLFQDQNTSALAAQAQRTQVLAQEANAVLQPVPPTDADQSNTCPQMVAYLRTRNQYLQSFVQFQNQYANSTADVRDAALQLWKEQNANLIAQMQQQATALAQLSPSSD